MNALVTWFRVHRPRPLDRVASIKTKWSIVIVAAVAVTALTSQIGYYFGWPVWLRPLVAGDERSATTALVMDCTLDGSVFFTSDGSLAEGSRWGVGTYGLGMRMEVIDGKWVVRQIGPAEQACIGM